MQLLDRKQGKLQLVYFPLEEFSENNLGEKHVVVKEETNSVWVNV